MVDNKKLNRYSLVSALIFNTALLLIMYHHGSEIFALSNTTELHEDETSEWFAQRGMEIRIFEYSENGTLTIKAVPILNQTTSTVPIMPYEKGEAI